MQKSILDFISKRPRLHESLASNGVHSSDGPNQDDCLLSDAVDEDTGCSTAMPSSTKPSKEKRCRDHQASKQRNRQEKRVDVLRPSTQGYRPGSNATTSKRKSKGSKANIPPPSCSEIVRLASTSGEKGSCRFYNKSLKDVYASCILPTETDFAASHTISSSAYSNTSTQKSQWKHTTHRPPRTSLPRTFSLSSQFSAHVCTAVVAVVSEGPYEESGVSVGNKRKRKDHKPSTSKPAPFKRKVPMKGRPRSYKIRLLPTKEQEVELRRCFYATDIAYNFANKRVRDDKVAANTISLKKDWVRADKELKDKTAGVSSRFTNQAIKDLVQAYTSNYAKLKANPCHKFIVKDRNEFSTLTKCIHVENQKVLLEVISVKSQSKSKRRTECKLRFGNNLEKHGPIRIQGKDKLIAKVIAAGTKLHADAMIQWDKSMDAFYFIWVDELLIHPDPDKSFQDKRIVALDPGSAPFQQWYSPTSGEFGVLLLGARDELRDRCQRIDKLRHRLDFRKRNISGYVTKKGKLYPKRKRSRKRQRTARDLRKKLRRECKRLSGNMQAAHYDAANFLLENHDIVVAPVLNTGRLMERSKRGMLGSKLARALYTWSHRLFRQRLAFAAARYPGRHVYECCEPGTSKTCTNCGAWKQDLRLGDKVYKCSRCGISVDRQLAGARNNFFAAYGMARGVGWDGL